ncbi:hypothetical protein [Kaistia adipata]|uniref:hypothetical protein n=1 Tax=Kaistia adipata TaxID=166954 RepID=UPI00048B2F69|nr:hypothetical protein [Kaistia adipata]
MIWHAAEVWAALAVCFIFGALVGSLFHRTVALTGARRAQANVIQALDGVVRSLERILMPWRGSVPATLPQTVPIPPPDFRPVADIPEVIPPVEPARHWDALPTVVADSAETAQASPAAAGSVPPAHSDGAGGADPALGFQPLPLPAPRNGSADPLHLIHGLTKRHAGRLARVGIFHFSQIASWTPQEVAWVAVYLKAGDAIVDKDWVGQAMHFASSDEPVLEPEPKPKPGPKSGPKSTPKSKPKAKPKRVATAGKAGKEAPAKAASVSGAVEAEGSASADSVEAKPAKRKRSAVSKGSAPKRAATARQAKPSGMDVGSDTSVAAGAPSGPGPVGQPTTPAED